MFLSKNLFIFVIEKIAALIGSGNSSIFMKYRDKLRFSMAGHALRAEFHHIIDAAFYKKEDGSSTVKNRPLFDLVYDRAITR